MSEKNENSSNGDVFWSSEKLILQDVFKDNQTLDDDSVVNDILLDFHKLDFTKNPCDDLSDVINYNEGKEADPFDKIAKYYGRNGNIFLFIAMLRNEELSKKIMIIISQKCDVQAKEKFIQRINIYLERIKNGEHDAKEFLSSDMDAFFNGYHIECLDHNRNIHANLNINAKPGQTLKTSKFFSETTNRIEEEKSELKRVKIFNNGKRILSIEKMEKQQRNYLFTKLATCNFEINWNAKDETGNDVCCAAILVITSGNINIGSVTINNENVDPKEILALSKQNKAIFIRNKTLHDAFQHFIDKTLREIKKD